jgi:hypothetical protein
MPRFSCVDAGGSFPAITSPHVAWRRRLPRRFVTVDTFPGHRKVLFRLHRDEVDGRCKAVAQRPRRAMTGGYRVDVWGEPARPNRRCSDRLVSSQVLVLRAPQRMAAVRAARRPSAVRGCRRPPDRRSPRPRPHPTLCEATVRAHAHAGGVAAPPARRSAPIATLTLTAVSEAGVDGREPVGREQAVHGSGLERVAPDRGGDHLRRCPSHGRHVIDVVIEWARVPGGNRHCGEDAALGPDARCGECTQAVDVRSILGGVASRRTRLSSDSSARGPVTVPSLRHEARAPPPKTVGVAWRVPSSSLSASSPGMDHAAYGGMEARR